MMKMRNKKGFTLMEMLIVVAIIAILVAIAIPTFSNALTKAKIATDKANVRAWYAERVIDIMMNNGTDFAEDTTGATSVGGETLTCGMLKITKLMSTGADAKQIGWTITYDCTANGATTADDLSLDYKWYDFN